MRALRAGLLAACLLVGHCPPVVAEPRPSSREVERARQTVRERSKELGRTNAALATAQARLDELAAEAGRLVEAYNGERVRLRQAEEARAQAQARLVAADAEVERVRQDVALLATDDHGGLGLMKPLVGMILDQGGTDGFLHRAGMLGHLRSERSALLRNMRDAQEVAAILRAQAANAHAAQRAAAERARLAKAAAGEAVARQLRETRALRVRKDRLQRKVDAARTRAELLARKRAAAARGLITGGSAMGDVAANWALTQLGKPYVWAADGPGSYDCSGLTMRAWERAGVRLDHWTGTQWTSGPRVPLDQLRRGDLLFFGHTADPSAIHHVGIYVGRGQMVHAPQTGDVVRVASIWRGDLVGATRPR
ncbi:C40 family peptidase [Nonomuraea aridisoli]|uniref:C40 family peptidase n=1 Tax=Nonomuraea aridisoli TaxID=2070368 RepID=UPI0015E88695|nr:C40 family peptidase [Nonomuraea aridisoli]